MQKIGSVLFSDLPQIYQDQFLTGKVEKDTQFFPFQPAEGTVTSAVVALLFYGIPAAALLFMAPYYILPNREAVREQIGEVVSASWQGLVIALLFSILIALTVWMLWQTWLAWRNVRIRRKVRRPQATEDEIFGILIDEDNIVIRHGDSFADFEFALIPRESIIQSFTSSMRVRTEADKVARFIDIVTIRFANHEKITDQLVLKEEFSLSSGELHQIINDWRQV